MGKGNGRILVKGGGRGGGEVGLSVGNLCLSCLPRCVGSGDVIVGSKDAHFTIDSYNNLCCIRCI